MPLRYRRQRFRNTIIVWCQRLFTLRNAITTVLMVAIFGVISPVFLVSFFDGIYAQGEVNLNLPDCIFTVFTTPEDRESLLVQLGALNCKRVYVFGTDYQTIREFVSFLDRVLVGVEVIPDFDARNAMDFCHNLAAQEVEAVVAISNRVQNIQLAYACDVVDIELSPLSIVEPSFGQKISSGFDLAQLIVLVNTTTAQ